MTEKSWAEIGELLEGIPNGLKYFFRLSYLTDRNQWVCSIDGVEAKAATPKEAIQLAATIHNAHFSILGFHLEIGMTVYIIEHLAVRPQTIVGFDAEQVIIQENAWTPKIAYELNDFQNLWFVDKENAKRHMAKSRRNATIEN